MIHETMIRRPNGRGLARRLRVAPAARSRPFAAALLGLTLFSLPAEAGPLQQPNGAPIPAPAGCNGGKTTGLAAAFACICAQPNVCNQGAACPGGSPSCDPGTNGTCETTTWHDVNDNPCVPTNLSGLDPVNDAKVVPETFHPTCPQTFTVVTRGTAMFQNAFGWYNVTAAAPAIADLHLMLDCKAGPGATAVLDLKAEPAYAGGDVAFFLVTPESHAMPGTCDGGDCCATLSRTAIGQGYVYFSERKYNPDFMGANSWIHLLTYESKISQSKYYFAWEDSNFSPNNDFTDLLTSVTGIQCSGAGASCDTGQKGICGAGLTSCQNGQLGCAPVFKSGTEQCNGLDDDCDGVIDNGAKCADPTLVCDHGKCVPHCSGIEFPCASGSVCDKATELCVEMSCVGVPCKAGEVCHGGQCAAPCNGVVCPHRQTCVADACVDLCGGVICKAGETCRSGLCFAGCAACDGISCALPTKCDAASGGCLDPSCPNGCPAGTFCAAGQCKDDCDGAKCPNGEACQGGVCGGAGGSGSSSSGIDVGGGGASASSSSSSSSSGIGGVDNGPGPAAKSGCGCRTAGDADDRDAGVALSLFGVFAASLARRRRLHRSST